MRLTNLFADTSKSRRFPAGTRIFEQGDTGEEMFIVDEGDVDIIVNGLHFETVSAEGFFGELCLVDQAARSGSAIARTDCNLQAVDKQQFLFLVQETPIFAIQVMKVMANRLRRINLLVAGPDLERANRAIEH